MSAAFATSFGARQVASHRRHPWSLDRFATPQKNAPMPLINSHSPEPLYDQHQTTAGDGFDRAHLKVAPKGWRVQMGQTTWPTSGCGSGSACGG